MPVNTVNSVTQQCKGSCVIEGSRVYCKVTVLWYGFPIRCQDAFHVQTFGRYLWPVLARPQTERMFVDLDSWHVVDLDS